MKYRQRRISQLAITYKILFLLHINSRRMVIFLTLGKAKKECILCICPHNFCKRDRNTLPLPLSAINRSCVVNQFSSPLLLSLWRCRMWWWWPYTQRSVVYFVNSNQYKQKRNIPRASFATVSIKKENKIRTYLGGSRCICISSTCRRRLRWFKLGALVAVHESTCKVVSRVYIYERKTYLGLSLLFATGGGIGGGRRRHSCGGLWSGCLRAASEQMSVHDSGEGSRRI